MTTKRQTIQAGAVVSLLDDGNLLAGMRPASGPLPGTPDIHGIAVQGDSDEAYIQICVAASAPDPFFGQKYYRGERLPVIPVGGVGSDESIFAKAVGGPITLVL